MNIVRQCNWLSRHYSSHWDASGTFRLCWNYLIYLVFPPQEKLQTRRSQIWTVQSRIHPTMRVLGQKNILIQGYVSFNLHFNNVTFCEEPNYSIDQYIWHWQLVCPGSSDRESNLGIGGGLRFPRPPTLWLRPFIYTFPFVASHCSFRLHRIKIWSSLCLSNHLNSDIPFTILIHKVAFLVVTFESWVLN